MARVLLSKNEDYETLKRIWNSATLIKTEIKFSYESSEFIGPENKGARFKHSKF